MLWLEYICFWLGDKLEDIPFSSLFSSLYSVKSQRVAPILGDMVDFFTCRAMVCVAALLLLMIDYGGGKFDDNQSFSKDCRQIFYGIEGNIVSFHHSAHPQ